MDDRGRRVAAEDREVALLRLRALVHQRASKRRADSFRIRILCGVLLLAACALPGCSSTSTSRTASDERPIAIGVPEGNVEGAELGVGYLTNQITLEGLTRLSIEGRALPRLATHWSWENNEHRLRLKLRNDVLLHDGRTLDAHIAAEALAVAIARPSNRASYPALNDVTAAQPDGPFDLLVDLSTPSSLLPEDLTVLLDVPAGPFRAVERTPTEIEFERFERYYLGEPSFKKVVLRPFDTLRTTWASLLRGELDIVSNIPADTIEFIENSDLHVLSVPQWYQFLIAFNSNRPPFESPLVRRALNLAVNRKALIDATLSGRAFPSTGPLWPRYWAYDRDVTPYPFDPGEASALLRQAGFGTTRPSPTPNHPPARVRFTCLLPEGFSTWERIALEVQRDLFNVGVDMQFQVVSAEEYNRLITAGDFDAVLIDLISGPTPARPYIFWRSARESKGQFNVFGYENSDAERFFQVIRTSTSEAAVRSATNRLQRVMLEDPPALFLAWGDRARAIRRDIVVPADNGQDPLWALWSWSRQPPQLASAR